MSQNLYVQYGCGLSAPKEWTNFDSSPTLRIQKIPIAGHLLRRKLNVVFPPNVKYGDIIKGLPVERDSCSGLYCSHVLEHLSLNDFRTALKNSYAVLKPGGIFRCVLPDLEGAARKYISRFDNGTDNASLDFMDNTLLGVRERPRGANGLISIFFGNSHHLWMWDFRSLSQALQEAGFVKIRRAYFNDSEDAMYKHVESAGRFTDAVALECRK